MVNGVVSFIRPPRSLLILSSYFHWIQRSVLGTKYEILKKVISLTKLSTIEVNALHNGDPRIVFDYQVGWAKTHLKSCGYLDSSKDEYDFLLIKRKNQLLKHKNFGNSEIDWCVNHRRFL